MSEQSNKIMYKSTDNVLEKKAINATLDNLAQAVTRCKQAVALDEKTMQSVFQSELQRENARKEYAKLTKVPTVLGVQTNIVMKYTVYTSNRQETRRRLLEAGFDMKNIDIVDGN